MARACCSGIDLPPTFGAPIVLSAPVVTRGDRGSSKAENNLSLLTGRTYTS